MITKQLLTAVKQEYVLPWDGVHGVSHWARVLENGLILAQQTGADARIIQLFALFHDSRRINENIDDGHGLRGAEFAASLRGLLFDLTDVEFDLLYTACAQHTAGWTDGDITVQTCWDADRLDLNRVGIAPDPAFLCTAAAKSEQVIRWANERSQNLIVPEFVNNDWNIG